MTSAGVALMGGAQATDLVLGGYGFGGNVCLGCDCDALPPRVVLIRPGESYRLVWDARVCAGCDAPNTDGSALRQRPSGSAGFA